ncbi:MAG: TetR/AcrR family transcriptional regulator [Acidimicrobiales bacterium]|nr:TetR/AcrR family transcriptional regulator [Acidimicrobiales bacterium]
MTDRPRPRNPKGKGARLRVDLLDAAADLLAEEGDVVSLRAIAARAGVSPTAVYRHFDDHLELLRAAVVHCWDEFERALVDAGASSDDPFVAFRAAGTAYIDFASRQPGKYRVLFSNKIDLGVDRTAGTSAFDYLVVMVAAMLDANGDRRDARFVAAQVHTWIHGMVDLLGRHPDEDWPTMDELLDELALRLGLTPTGLAS